MDPGDPPRQINVANGYYQSDANGLRDGVYRGWNLWPVEAAMVGRLIPWSAS
jgi:hypothetical protein